LKLSFGFLIDNIEKPTEELTLASGMIESSYTILQDHYKKIADHLASVDKHLTTIREQHERIRKIFSIRVLSKGSNQPIQISPEKQFQCEDENRILILNNENVFLGGCYAKIVVYNR